MVPRRYIKEKLGLDDRYGVSYSVNSKGVMSLKQHKADKRGTVALYPIKDGDVQRTKPTRVKEDSPEYFNMMDSGNWTEDAPALIERPLTPDQVKELGFSTDTIEKWKNSGQTPIGEILPNGTVGKFRLQKSVKDDSANFMNPNTGEYYPLNKNDIRHMELVRTHGLVETNITQPGISKSTSATLREQINSAQGALGIVKKLNEMKLRMGEGTLLGTVGRFKRAFQSFGDMLTDIAGAPGEVFLEFTGFANEVARDYDINDPLITDQARAYFNRDLAATPFLQNVLVYKLAKVFKEGRKLNMDDVRKAKEALGFNVPLTGEQTVFSRLEEASKLFIETIKNKQAQFTKISRGRLKIPGVKTKPDQAEQTISPAGRISRPRIVANQNFIKIPKEKAIAILLADDSPKNRAQFNKEFGKAGTDVATFIFGLRKGQN